MFFLLGRQVVAAFHKFRHHIIVTTVLNKENDAMLLMKFHQKTELEPGEQVSPQKLQPEPSLALNIFYTLQ